MLAGERFTNEAETAITNHRSAIARELLLKASGCYATAYHPIYGFPVDPRFLSAFRKQVSAFNKAMSLSTNPVIPFRIPFGGTTMPGYFIPAVEYPHAVRPLIIFTNGYDATITDMFFTSAVAASERGYHCLLFDGPGQGECCMSKIFHCDPIGKK